MEIKDIRFKISGFVYLFAIGVSLILGYVGFVTTWQSYSSLNLLGKANIPPKILNPLLITAELLSYTAFIILIIAIIHMDTSNQNQ